MQLGQEMGDPSPPKDGRDYPHLDDLVARANPKVDIHVPMRTLLQIAHTSAKQAETYLDFKRPDLAYVEYLTASNIVVELVPRHKDFPSLNADRGELWRLNKDIRNRINIQHNRFEKVRELIKADNARSGVRPTATLSERPRSTKSHQAGEEIPESLRVARAPYDAPNALQMPDGPLGEFTTVTRPQSWPDAPSRSPNISQANLQQTRINISSMPASEDLRRQSSPARGVHGQGRSTPHSRDLLAERFARIRSTDNLRPADGQAPPGPGDTSRMGQVYSDSWSSTQLTPSSSATSLSRQAQSSSATDIETSSQGPHGPRAMPAGSNVYSQLQKTSLTIQTGHALPRAPSPTYSPARNSPTPSEIHPPRTSARSLVSAVGRPRPVAPVNGTNQPSIARKDVPIPPSSLANGNSNIGRGELQNQHETLIGADILLSYLKKGSDNFSILLIDARDRRAFDDGHIFAPSIICVEPIGLRPRMSAEEIGEALVLSPETEQQLFHQRNLFDLVIYYDQSSTSDLDTSDSQHLSILKHALWHFSFEKPLKRPPALLVGGLDAWMDLLGRQALQSSNTIGPEDRRITQLGPPQRWPGRPSSRNNAQAIDDNRSSRGHEPLDYQEEEAWMARIRDESGERGHVRRPPVKESQWVTPETSEDRAPFVRKENDEVLFLRTYDDFLRRFPEPSELKESMITPRTPLERSIIDHPFHNFTGVQTSRRQGLQTNGTIPLPLSNPPSRPPPAVPRQSYSGVSERVSPQVPAPSRPPPISPQSPLASDTIMSRSEHKIGRTGLTNFGATCYMNAVTQCLSATSPLTRYFLDGSYKLAVQKGNKLGSNGLLPEVYANLMWHLWNDHYTSISPKTFRVSFLLGGGKSLGRADDKPALQEFISRLNGEFRNPDVQHDANDFLVFLLDALHEDLNVNCARTRLNDLTPAEERKRESMPPQVASRVEWNRWSHRNMSCVSRLFGGQHMSRLRCPVCGCTSTSYETFYSISLEIPRKGRAHIYDCLQNYTKEEKLGAEDSWTCPHCKVPREASKQITITRAPQILVIQLKRFKSVRRGFTDKNNTLIDFPLTGLDLTPFSMPPLNRAEMEEAQRTYDSAIMAAAPHETTAPLEYDAYGVVQHFGTLTGGHYTALIRGSTRGQWMEFNDKVVSQFDARNVASAAAYLLFYVRSNVR